MWSVNWSWLSRLVDEAGNARIEVMVEAALQGHDLTGFEPVEGPPPGQQARCRRCGQTAWVGESGLVYSLLDDVCQGSGGSDDE